MGTAALLNVLATALVVGCGLVALYHLDWTHRAEGRFLFRAFACWLLAWAAWLALWGVEAARIGPLQDPSLRHHVILILSDINTAMVLLFYVALTRGDAVRPAGLMILAGAFIFVFVLVDLALMNFPGPASIGPMLQERWSMALSMAAPVLVGWGCSLRYGSSWPLIVGVIYAIGQPPAQLAVLSDAVPVEVKNTVLTLLAAMKVIYGAAVIQSVGTSPITLDNLVADSRRTSRPVLVRPWWPILSYGLLATGLIGIAGFTALKQRDVFGPLAAQIATVVGFIAGVLKIVEFVGKKAADSK